MGVKKNILSLVDSVIEGNWKSNDSALQMYRTRGKLIDGHPGCTQPLHQGGSSMKQRIAVNRADDEDLYVYASEDKKISFKKECTP